MITRPRLILITLGLYMLCSCKKNDGPGNSTIIQKTFIIENIFSANLDVDTTRKGFIDLYDGIAYSKAQAIPVSSQIDFIYEYYYHSGCNPCRLFANIKQSDYYVQGFSARTNSQITLPTGVGYLSIDDFESVKTGNDIDSLFVKHSVDTHLWFLTDVTDRSSDVAVEQVFAFTDKNGKKGLFRIADYTANLQNGDPAPMTITVKIKK